MSAHIITINNYQIVFGLDWIPLLGEMREKDEVCRYARHLNAAYQIRYQAEHAILYGFLAHSDLPEASAKSQVLSLSKVGRIRYISASILLATFPNIAPNAIWVEIEGQTAKMAILKDGVPLPSGDFLGSIQEVDERIRQIEADSYVNFTQYGNSGNSGNSEQRRHRKQAVIPLSIEKLLHDNSNEALLVRASRPINRPLLAFIAMMGIGLTYHFGSAYFHSVKTVKKTPEHLGSKVTDRVKSGVKDSAPQDPDPTATYLNALPEKLAQAGVPVNAAMAAIHGDWRTEILQGGWVLSKISCTIAACVYHWLLNGGNNLSLRQSISNDGRRNRQHQNLHLRFSRDGRTATYRLPNAPVKSARLDIATLPYDEDFRMITGAFLQDVALLGVRFRFTRPVLFGADNRTAMHLSARLSALPGAVKSGGITMNGPAALLEETLQHLPDTITIESMDLKINGVNPKFEVKGTYYVKN